MAALDSAPVVAFAFVGVEIVAVIAVEAEDSEHSLKQPSRRIAPLMVFLYFVSAVAYYASLSWSDSKLPSLPSLSLKTTTSYKGVSDSIVVIAAADANQGALADVLNVFLILAVLSTANTSLYVASRILFGLTRDINPNGRFSWFAYLAETTRTKKIPLAALWVSALAFWWVPWLTWNSDIISGTTVSY